MSDDRFLQFLIKAFTAAYNTMRPGASFYIWHADTYGLSFRRATEVAGLELKECLIWVKNSIVLGRQDYQWKHEPCLYGWKTGAAHYFINDRSQSTVFEDTGQDYRKWKKNDLIKLIKELQLPDVPTTVIYEDKPLRNADHPTMKPVKLFGRLILNSTKKDGIILDSFGGSGTSIIAAEQLDRTCYTMELDPHYCDVIINRWEKLTGQKARRIEQ